MKTENAISQEANRAEILDRYSEKLNLFRKEMDRVLPILANFDEKSQNRHLQEFLERKKEIERRLQEFNIWKVVLGAVFKGFEVYAVLSNINNMKFAGGLATFAAVLFAKYKDYKKLFSDPVSYLALIDTNLKLK